MTTPKTAIEIARDFRDFTKIFRSPASNDDVVYTLWRIDETPGGERTTSVVYQLTGEKLLEAADKLDAQRTAIATMHAAMYPAIEDAETKFILIVEALQEANSGGLTGDQAVERITEILIPTSTKENDAEAGQ